MFVIVAMIEQSLNNKLNRCEKSEWTISYPVEIHIKVENNSRTPTE